jgi:hypothetical protein
LLEIANARDPIKQAPATAELLRNVRRELPASRDFMKNFTLRALGGDLLAGRLADATNTLTMPHYDSYTRLK